MLDSEHINPLGKSRSFEFSAPSESSNEKSKSNKSEKDDYVPLENKDEK